MNLTPLDSLYILTSLLLFKLKSGGHVTYMESHPKRITCFCILTMSLSLKVCVYFMHPSHLGDPQVIREGFVYVGVLVQLDQHQNMWQ